MKQNTGLSIEEKAKKYDKACQLHRERVKKWRKKRWEEKVKQFLKMFNEKYG